MTAAELLGLPPANTVGATDSALGWEYLAFTNNLQGLPGGRVVVVSPYQLSVKTEGIGDSASKWYASLSEQDRTRLLLLSVISRPFDPARLWPEGQPRFADNEMVALFFSNENPQSLAESGAAVPFGLDTVPGQKTLTAHPALRKFAQSLPRRAAIETISSEFIGGQPGNYGYQMWQICRWADDWAVVFGVTDAARDEGYPFPWLLGFCRMEGLQRNFVELLRVGRERFDIGFYYTYGTVLTRWPLAKVALISDDSSEGPDWRIIDWLLTLDEAQLDELLSNVDSKTDALTLLERLRRILDSTEYLNLGEISLAELLGRAGANRSLEQIEQKIREWEQEQEDREQGELAERQRKIAQFSDAIAAVLARMPSLPIDQRYPTTAQATWHNDARRDIVRRYIEDYVAQHQAMPMGRRDFGVLTVRSGFAHFSPVRVGLVDFDSTP